jgi:hypothetical protein
VAAAVKDPKTGTATAALGNAKTPDNLEMVGDARERWRADKIGIWDATLVTGDSSSTDLLQIAPRIMKA